MSLITGNPDESPRDCSTKHHRRRRRALIALSSAVASLVSLTIILWLTLRPSSPQFTLAAATATFLPNATAVAVDAAFTAHNPNARAAALYDRLQARASFETGGDQVQLAYAAPLPPFEQPQGDLVLSTSLSSPSPPPVDVAEGGRALLRLRVEGQLRWKVGAWVSGRHALRVDCIAVVLLQPSRSSSSQQLRAVMVGVAQGFQCGTTLS